MNHTTHTTTEHDRLVVQSDELFDEGVRLMDAGQTDEGSTLIERSQMADRAIGKGHYDTAREIVKGPQPALDRHLLTFLLDGGFNTAAGVLTHQHASALRKWRS